LVARFSWSVVPRGMNIISGQWPVTSGQLSVYSRNAPRLTTDHWPLVTGHWLLPHRRFELAFLDGADDLPGVILSDERLRRVVGNLLQLGQQALRLSDAFQLQIILDGVEQARQF